MDRLGKRKECDVFAFLSLEKSAEREARVLPFKQPPVAVSVL